MSYAFERLGHAIPILCPVRALLLRVPLGPRPSLHQLRGRSPGFVRRLPSDYGEVYLLLAGLPARSAQGRSEKVVR
jgi:hypothetical protein